MSMSTNFTSNIDDPPVDPMQKTSLQVPRDVVKEPGKVEG